MKKVYPEIRGSHSGPEGKSTPTLSLSGIRLSMFSTSFCFLFFPGPGANTLQNIDRRIPLNDNGSSAGPPTTQKLWYLISRNCGFGHCKGWLFLPGAHLHDSRVRSTARTSQLEPARNAAPFHLMIFTQVIPFGMHRAPSEQTAGLRLFHLMMPGAY